MKEIMEEIEANKPNLDSSEVFGIVRDDQAGQESGGVRWYRDLITPWRIEDI